eukprot:CAMPEP_0177657650 /NCGR_PEP_ID=MMETSP0447-20121125/16319_1 /TAXON_ID=0 /ORGANISM="Stygamoeba regulata, Strain BSH-02190019" /LENGTH=242 /DNA_ID=CAMNT_0019162061 /DNA_START=69 /DNA_END=797 /DNA_ORIENTATION=+
MLLRLVVVLAVASFALADDCPPTPVTSVQGVMTFDPNPKSFERAECSNRVSTHPGIILPKKIHAEELKKRACSVCLKINGGSVVYEVVGIDMNSKSSTIIAQGAHQANVSVTSITQTSCSYPQIALRFVTGVKLSGDRLTSASGGPLKVQVLRNNWPIGSVHLYDGESDYKSKYNDKEGIYEMNGDPKKTQDLMFRVENPEKKEVSDAHLDPNQALARPYAVLPVTFGASDPRPRNLEKTCY